MLSVPADFNDYIKTCEGISFWTQPDGEEVLRPLCILDRRQRSPVLGLVCSGFISGSAVWSRDCVSSTIFFEISLCLHIMVGRSDMDSPRPALNWKIWGDNCSHWNGVPVRKKWLCFLFDCGKWLDLLQWCWSNWIDIEQRNNRSKRHQNKILEHNLLFGVLSVCILLLNYCD